jgi:hypothetical protein
MYQQESIYMIHLQNYKQHKKLTTMLIINFLKLTSEAVKSQINTFKSKADHQKQKE